MPLYYRGKITTNDLTSRNTSHNTDPPVSEQPTLSSINSPSPRMDTARKELAVESETSWGPTSAEPVVRYSTSPPPTVKCDGFGLCDNFSTEMARVVSQNFIGFLTTIA
jgi:metacaspase-1